MTKPEQRKTARIHELLAAKAMRHSAFLIALLALAVSGCQRAEQNVASSATLTGVPSKLLLQRGELVFVSDIEAGRRLAEEKDLPCMLFFTADWCTYCHEMEETAFLDPKVAQMAGNFVCVLVDADREKGVCEQFAVSGYPTIQFVSSQGRVLNRLVGRQSAPELVAGMRAALKRFAWLDDPATKLR